MFKTSALESARKGFKIILSVKGPSPPLSFSKCLSYEKCSQTFDPPPFLHTLSNQKLDGGKVWEQGYRKHGIMLNDQAVNVRG